MSEQSSPVAAAARTVVLTLPGMDDVQVQHDLPYRATDGDESFDLYVPAVGQGGDLRPVVVFVTGYPDEGMQRVFGCRAKEMGSYASWGRLVAASGMCAVAYTARHPADDLGALLRHLRTHAASLGIDASRIGVWSCSGNVPNAVPLLMRDAESAVACAVLLYGYLLDLDGSTTVADGARQFYFANPCAGRSIDDVRDDLPLCIVRAGRDEMPGLNGAIDAFVVAALRRNLPITVVNHATAPHAFDVVDDTDGTRSVMRQALRFLAQHLGRDVR